MENRISSDSSIFWGKEMFEIIERYANEYKFSDIHIKEDQPLILRINGEMTKPSDEVISALPSE